MPVVPQGARTGLAGAANAVDGAIVLSTVAMDEILEIDPVNRVAVVQPGVINSALAAAARDAGLRYPPDPGSWESSTIGGNVATNAGGMCCVKYGVTAEYVLGLEVVLASGEVLRTGRRTAKGVAGLRPDPAVRRVGGHARDHHAVTIALRPPADESLTLIAVFPTTAAAGEAVAAISSGGLSPSLLELLDQTHLRAIEALPTDGAAYRRQGAAAGRRSTPGRGPPADLARLASACEAAGAVEVYSATDAVEAAELLRARRLAHAAMEKYAAETYPEGNGGLIIDDVAVPRTALAVMLDGIEKIALEYDVPIGVVGHAGRRQPAPQHRRRPRLPGVRRAGPRRVRRDHEAGAVAGRHVHRRARGGAAQARLAGDRDRPGRRGVHRAIKAALDPAGLLNPGKIL